MSLAVRLHKLPRELEGESVTDLLDVAASLSLDPPDKGDDWRTAAVCSVLANTVRDPAKKPQPFQPIDFMPGEVKPPQGESEIVAAFLSAGIPVVRKERGEQ